MKQRFKTLTGGENLRSRGAMETGDHFKNGVNLQNLSSRGNVITIQL
jgi:hypothetical protein